MVGIDVATFVVKVVGAGVEAIIGASVGDSVGHGVRDCSIATDDTDGNCCCSAVTKVSGFKASAIAVRNSLDVGMFVESSLK